MIVKQEHFDSHFLTCDRVSECGQGGLSSVTGRSRERSAGVLLQAELRSGGGCTACTRPGHAQNILVNDRNNNKTQDMATKQCYYSLSEHLKIGPRLEQTTHDS